ncbi:HAD family hydrolase [Rhodococcoides kyotonense]|uniref:Haloacid dehalogenase superfamily, subfamily IA, variant 3 with third motif having DD or ED/haloacid dehalogenase superfamily, subfamily IA, variant 1 with third motif having Dx(3-4)D or Dx(3-4)E n=1 Tax=Rhodococcoides kyotonense TaxID=398843 RepID=A0A239F5Y1_9NOCA|nr:HAD family hydrolase [Rhodococcus kyotonensis]SNS51693.1 haloacid dehalogenase superfamily, subfamily IA, variant 3 with third motif having DD or ED/haloacid dehalogenase superfamily, subfamily IA, variant 1 with third motif having Dx(3-4)D or Dx(3-4)E [Rhodococcus kyotonensis]
MTPRPRAVLFDIDGTLVDSNYVHVDTWSRAFADAGVSVPSWKIHRCIGMDGDKLLEALVGAADSAVALEAKDLHSDYYGAASGRLQILPGARELLHRIEDDGLTVVLATSAPESELATLRDLLDVEDIVSVVTSSEDAEDAKPDPEIVDVALQRAHVAPEDALLVGDSVWDMKASRQAGVSCIAVRSGGIPDAELRAAGADEVYEDPADLLDKVAGSAIGRLIDA